MEPPAVYKNVSKPSNMCKRSGCLFKKNTDIANNGGTHCCLTCKKGGGEQPWSTLSKEN